jgi:hypothetical protein
MSRKLRMEYSGAGGFEGAIEFAQGPAVGGHDLVAQKAQTTCPGVSCTSWLMQ